MSQPKILVFAGSARRDSFNKKLAREAAEDAKTAGGEVTFIDLADYPMPLFNGDLEDESGLPENAKKIKALMKEHHAFIIASPEYNSSITGLLKNTIDWASREETDDEPPLVCYKGKIVLLLSASPGGLGGIRSLIHVRSILGNIGCIVLPDQLSIPVAHEAFDEEGRLKDARKKKQLIRLTADLVKFVAKFHS